MDTQTTNYDESHHKLLEQHDRAREMSLEIVQQIEELLALEQQQFLKMGLHPSWPGELESIRNLLVGRFVAADVEVPEPLLQRIREMRP